MSYQSLDQDKLKRIAARYFAEAREHLTSPATPRLILIAAQPGAGKTGMSKIIKAELLQEGETAMHIDADVMRTLIPDYQKYSSAETQADAGRLVQMVRELANEARVNIIEEGTFRDADVAEKFVKNAQGRGYKVEVHALSVPKAVSRIGIYERYDAQKSVRDFRNARYITVEYHDNAFEGFSKTVQRLDGVADRLRVRRRGGRVLSDSDVNPGGAYKALIEGQKLDDESKRYVMETYERLKEKEIRRGEDTEYLEVLKMAAGV